MTLPPEMLEETFEVLLIFMYISFNITLIVNENFTYIHTRKKLHLYMRLSPAGDCKGSCTLNVGDGQVLFPSSKEL